MGKIILVGAGGTGMSAIAEILFNLGLKNIVCVDSSQSELTDKLSKKGLKVIIGHGKQKVSQDDIIIYSEATVNSAEVTEAKEISKSFKKPMIIWSYFKLLGEISKYFVTAGFAGTNGKSSSSAMGIFAGSRLLPNFGLGILGTLIKDLDNQNYYINQSIIPDLKNIFEYIFTGKNLNYNLIKKYIFFVEACEYKRQFLNLDLDYSVITNIDLDHTDYYKDQADYDSAFQSLANQTKKKIFILDSVRIPIVSSKIKKVRTDNIELEHVRGLHNQQNASLVTSLILDISGENTERTQIISLLKKFKGLRRRMEYLGSNSHNAMIFSDYGHVAESIEVVSNAMKWKYPNKKLTVIFQPHQIIRIAEGWDKFIKNLTVFNKVVIYDIYAARENPSEIFSKFENLKSLNIKDIDGLGDFFAKSCNGIYTTDMRDIESIIKDSADDEIVIIFSAGNLDFKVRSMIPAIIK